MGKKDRNKNRGQEHQKWASGDEESLTPLDSGLEKPVKSESIGDSPMGFFMVNTESGNEDGRPLDDEDLDEYISIGTNPDAVMKEIDDYTNDPDVLDDFADRQTFTQGSDELLHRLRQHNAENPGLSAGDIDAAWDDASQSGEETVGGLNPTPDQDRVDDIGEAVGIEYEDGERLGTLDKIAGRDRDRWELNPASAETFDRDLEGDLDEEDLDEDLDLLDEELEDDADEVEDLAILDGVGSRPFDKEDEDEFDDEDDLDKDVEALDETFGLYDDGLDELDDEDLADLDEDDY